MSEELTAQLDEAGEEFAGALMELYGEALERIVDAVADEGSDALKARLPTTARSRASC